MSFCRWSSDSYRCDLYVYEDVNGGFTIHVAGRKRVFSDAVPCPEPIEKVEAESGGDFAEKYMQWWKQMEAANNAASLVPIVLPHAGESFNVDTLTECIAKCEELKALGYNVPDAALDAMKAEAHEG